MGTLTQNPVLGRDAASGRARRGVGLALITLLVCGLPTVVGGQPVGAEAASLSIVPSTGLVDEQLVDLHATGLGVDRALHADVCIDGRSECRPIVAFHADPTGSVATPLRVPIRTFGPGHLTQSCREVGCVVRLVDAVDSSTVVEQPITFDPEIGRANPWLQVSPAAGLSAGDVVHITGNGFDPGDALDVAVCAAGDPSDCEKRPITTDRADSGGSFALDRQVARTIPGSGTDCGQVRCELRVIGSGAGAEVTAALAFGTQAALRPTATVAPLTGLGIRNPATVTFSGFPAWSWISSDQCFSDDQADADCSPRGGGFADRDGAGSFPIVMRAGVVGTEDGGWCPDANTVCVIDVSGPGSTFRQTLTFVPNPDPLPDVPVAVAPHRDLQLTATAEVRSSGLIPGERVSLAECRDATPLVLGGTQCDGLAAVTVNRNGDLVTSVSVHRFIGSGQEFPFDCAAPDAGCHVSIRSIETRQSGSAPISFDPNGTLPPRPAVAAVPNRDLVSGASISITGSGFTPGAPFAIGECGAHPDSINDCSTASPRFGVVSAAGTISETYPARAVLSTGRGPVDCRTQPDACVLAVVNFNEFAEGRLVPLTFAAAGDPDPSLELDDAVVTEGSTPFGLTGVALSAHLSRPVDHDVVATLRTRAGTATAGVDYVESINFGNPGVLVIPAGATSGTVTALVWADALDEPTERFKVVVDAAAGATVKDGSATVSIHDDDPAPSLVVGDATVHEGEHSATVGVMLTAPSGRDITVRYETHHHSARSGSDFARTRGSVTIRAGQVAALVHIPIVDDTRHERTEDFRVEFTDAEHANLDHHHDTATVTIFDND